MTCRDIKRACKNCQNIKISATDYLGQYEQQHRTHFDITHSEFLDQVKHAELQCLKDPSKINANNLKDVRSETSRPSGTKRQKGDINELNINCKKRKSRGL
jgi:hypothetical protein